MKINQTKIKNKPIKKPRTNETIIKKYKNNNNNNQKQSKVN